MSSVKQFFTFPAVVNDVAARAVATGVVIMALLVAGLGWGWVLVPLTYGFIARVLAGPKISPLGLIATKVVAPRLPAHEKLVAGPPKRFAQGIGVVFSISASALWLAGQSGGARIVIAMLAVAASLEAFAGFCLGCKIFAGLMNLGMIPESACVECSNLSLAQPQTAAESRETVQQR